MDWENLSIVFTEKARTLRRKPTFERVWVCSISVSFPIRNAKVLEQEPLNTKHIHWSLDSVSIERDEVGRFYLAFGCGELSKEKTK